MSDNSESGAHSTTSLLFHPSATSSAPSLPACDLQVHSLSHQEQQGLQEQQGQQEQQQHQEQQEEEPQNRPLSPSQSFSSHYFLTNSAVTAAFTSPPGWRSSGQLSSSSPPTSAPSTATLIPTTTTATSRPTFFASSPSSPPLPSLVSLSFLNPGGHHSELREREPLRSPSPLFDDIFQPHTHQETSPAPSLATAPPNPLLGLLTLPGATGPPMSFVHRQHAPHYSHHHHQAHQPNQHYRQQHQPQPQHQPQHQLHQHQQQPQQVEDELHHPHAVFPSHQWPLQNQLHQQHHADEVLPFLLHSQDVSRNQPAPFHFGLPASSVPVVSYSRHNQLLGLAGLAEQSLVTPAPQPPTKATPRGGEEDPIALWLSGSATTAQTPSQPKGTQSQVALEKIVAAASLPLSLPLSRPLASKANAMALPPASIPLLTSHEQHAAAMEVVDPRGLKRPKRGRRSKDFTQNPDLEKPEPKILKKGNRAGVFICQVSGCGQFFSRKEHLERHLLMHTGEKPFKCTLCPRGFSREDNLKQHIRVHQRRFSEGETAVATSSVHTTPTLFLAPASELMTAPMVHAATADTISPEIDLNMGISPQSSVSAPASEKEGNQQQQQHTDFTIHHHVE